MSKTRRESDSIAGIWATVETGDLSNEATFSIQTFEYPEDESDIQAVISFDGFEVAVCMSPEKARSVRQSITQALDEVDNE